MNRTQGPTNQLVTPRGSGVATLAFAFPRLLAFPRSGGTSP